MKEFGMPPVLLIFIGIIIGIITGIAIYYIINQN